jgi:hypothetical protein
MLCRIRHQKTGWNVSFIHEVSAASLGVIGITPDADSRETTTAPVAQRSTVKYLINSWGKKELAGHPLTKNAPPTTLNWWV